MPTVNDYAGPVLKVITDSTNSQTDLAMIVETAEEAISQIAEDVGDLLTQRDRLVELHRNYVSIYRALHQEELRTREEVREVATLPQIAHDSEEIRQKILEIAESYSNMKVQVTESAIAMRLKQDFRELPWKNPNAVIATILRGSRMWHKSDSGAYQQIDKDVPN